MDRKSNKKKYSLLLKIKGKQKNQFDFGRKMRKENMRKKRKVFSILYLIWNSDENFWMDKLEGKSIVLSFLYLLFPLEWRQTKTFFFFFGFFLDLYGELSAINGFLIRKFFYCLIEFSHSFLFFLWTFEWKCFEFPMDLWGLAKE